MTFFFRSELEQISPEGASFRSLRRTTAAQRERALAAGELALELTTWIDGRFVLPSPDIPDLRPQRDPEAAAMALRGRWGLGDLPIGNVLHLLEAKGVRVFSLVEDCHEIDAFSFWRSGQPFVFLNTMKSSERSRFDAAHELGHLVLHRHGSPAGRTAEQEADAFASAFLMPRSSIITYAPRLPSLPSLVDAKSTWNVSVLALVHRMHAVGMISAWGYRSLCIQIQERGFRRAEPESGPREMSQVFEKVFSALRQEGVRRVDLAHALGWPLSELQALVFGLVLTARSSTRDATGHSAAG
jgi:Zn-dependent peptidase ImmA (M78 family)